MADLMKEWRYLELSSPPERKPPSWIIAAGLADQWSEQAWVIRQQNLRIYEWMIAKGCEHAGAFGLEFLQIPMDQKPLG